MRQYLELVSQILDAGEDKEDRTGTGTYSVFGRQMRFNLEEGFPLLTTKKIHFKSIAHELLWFISGETNTDYLKQNGVSIWDEWADEDGNLGPVYGAQWRNWPVYEEFEYHMDDCDVPFSYFRNTKSVDQLSQVIKDLKTNPNSRRHVVSTWNVADLSKMALPPCHLLFQFYVARGKLSCQMYQRSADVFLGIPFNIASYALLTHLVAQVCDLKVGEFIHTLGDAHIYKNHVEQMLLQLSREPKALPQLELNPAIKHIEKFSYADIQLVGYNPHPPIKGEVSV